MLFLLFGSITRYKHSQTVPPEVIHFQQKKSSGTIRFRSHNITYEIQKRMSRSTNGKIKVEEKLFKIHSDGAKVDLSEEHRKKTDKFVVSQIGTSTQFLFTNIFLQTNEQSFRSMTPKDRKDFLYDILELSQLEQHYQENYIKWKENKNLLDQIEKELPQLHVELEQIQDFQQQLSKLEKEKEEDEDNLSSIQKQIRDKLSTKKPCPLSANEMEQQKKMIQNNIDKLEKEKQILEQEKKKHVEIQSELLEQTRNDLWQSIELLYKKIKPFPTMDTSSFRLGREQLCPHQPTAEDVESFRQEVYDQFSTESQSILQIVEDEDYLIFQKEQLLLSLYPEPDPSTDTFILQKELETLQDKVLLKSNITEELVEATYQLSLLETELCELEKKWNGRWEEWDQLQKEPDMVRFMLGLRFNGKCHSCSHNETTLQTCLLEAEKFKQQKLRLWETISQSKEKQNQLKKQIVDTRKKVVELQQQQQVFQKITQIKHILDNRSTQKKLSVIKIQQHWFRVKKLWEETKRVAEQRLTILETNQKVENKIQKKKQKVATLDHLRRLLDQWREITLSLDKEKTKLAELKQWEQNVKENSQIDCWVHDKEQQEKALKSKLNHNMDHYIMKKQELNLLVQKMEAKQKKETQYNEILQEHKLLTRLLQILHRDGLPMYFLEQYLPQLESRINELISPFLKQKKIVLRKEQKKETINILLSISTLGSETNYMGGMEGFIVDASIKEVLAEVSLQCKSNLFIIDEGISALDKKNMENLDQFFHFLEERHPHVFIISHLSEAQHIVRHSLQISKIGDYSKIEYV
jgi:DNA repair exonuclease SbcCD ATPase subunit